MTDARWQSFFDKMVHAGVVKAGPDYRRGYTLRFVDKGVGVQLRPSSAIAVIVRLYRAIQ